MNKTVTSDIQAVRLAIKQAKLNIRQIDANIATLIARYPTHTPTKTLRYLVRISKEQRLAPLQQQKALLRNQVLQLEQELLNVQYTGMEN